jgi:hypothetical protein
VQNDSVRRSIMVRLRWCSTSSGASPCHAAAAMVCRAIPVTEAAAGPVPHTSPMTTPQVSGVMLKTS